VLLTFRQTLLSGKLSLPNVVSESLLSRTPRLMASVFRSRNPLVFVVTDVPLVALTSAHRTLPDRVETV
jgi:hypothetical protein